MEVLSDIFLFVIISLLVVMRNLLSWLTDKLSIFLLMSVRLVLEDIGAVWRTISLCFQKF